MDGSILGGLSGSAAIETPANLVALGGGAKLALLALGGGFEGAATAHFFENTLGVQLGLEAFESTVDGLAFIGRYGFPPNWPCRMSVTGKPR